MASTVIKGPILLPARRNNCLKNRKHGLTIRWWFSNRFNSIFINCICGPKDLNAIQCISDLAYRIILDDIHLNSSEIRSDKMKEKKKKKQDTWATNIEFRMSRTNQSNNLRFCAVDYRAKTIRKVKYSCCSRRLLSRPIVALIAKGKKWMRF